MKVAITGTPGTGKSHLSKKLAKKLGYTLIELNEVIKKEKLYDCYDRSRRTYVTDIKKIKRHFKNLDKDVIIDSHLSHYLNVDIVIVLRCEPDKLRRRLIRKKWNKAKIEENVEAEMISLISWEARQRHKKVFDVDTSNNKALSVMERIIKGKGTKYKKQINWL